jgi:hypothetical protein
MPVLTVDDLYANLPRVHRGGSHTFYIAKETAHLIDDLVGPSSDTLETGCGLSTVLFALRGGHHTCITQRQEEVDRVRAYAADNDIDVSRVAFLVGNSQDILPSLAREPVDVVLVDGQHAFPVPFLDWYYANRLLRVGGTLIVDDTQIWTGRVLRQFLSAEPSWHRTSDFFGRAAVFTKIAHVESQGWGRQPFVVRRSRFGRWAEKARRRIAVASGRLPDEHNRKAPMTPEAQSIPDGTP